MFIKVMFVMDGFVVADVTMVGLREEEPGYNNAVFKTFENHT